MTFRAKLNIALSAGLLALFVVIYLEQRETADTRVMVAEFDADQVGTLRIEKRGREPILLRRVGDDWRMLEPLEIPVDGRRVREIIDSLSVRSQANYPVSRMQIGTLKLGDEPLARLVVDGETWIIGDRSPLQGWRYIRHGDTVHLAHDVLYFRLPDDAAGFASRQLLPPGSTIERIVLPGIGADASQGLLDAWRTAMAVSVVGATLRVANNDFAGDTALIYLAGEAEPITFRIHLTDEDFSLVRDDYGLEYRMARMRATEMLEPAGSDTKPEE